MLHIITPLYRFSNLEIMYNSILMNDDITWHISKSIYREELNFIKNDNRIKIYNINCEDFEIGKKRDYALKNIKNGYFCFLDDDTIFHENMYMKYKECEEENFIGMLVGQQIDYDNEIRLISSKPVLNYIDVGNVISHTSCLSKCVWPETPYTANDYVFWNSVYEFYGKKCAIWNQPISFYNKINPKQNYDTKKKKLVK